jgi:hypothetical protein
MFDKDYKLVQTYLNNNKLGLILHMTTHGLQWAETLENISGPRYYNGMLSLLDGRADQPNCSCIMSLHK